MARDQRRLAAIVSADVAGYSRLMGSDESSTLAALKSHRRELIDPKIAEYGGRIVKTTGDGLLLEFPSVVDAIQCAVDMQRGMAERNVSVETDRQMRFRIGINVGDIIVDGDDIYGDGVNVAARLETLAEPGGICVSAIVRDQARVDRGIEFMDLGEQNVKNIERPIRVFRLGFRTTGTQASPAGAAWNHRFGLPVTKVEPQASTNHNLPSQLTSFIGREEEIAQLKELLKTNRLVTLTGAGGAGKTRLAIEVAGRLLDTFADGVWLVELAALSDPQLVSQAAAEVLGLKEQPGKSLTETICGNLASRNLLLVLDNAEHLLGACVQLADQALRRSTRLAILVTSREPLHLSGELTFRVPSLTVPTESDDGSPDHVRGYEAVRLFLDRGRLSRPTFGLTAENAPAVASICTRLDGIPLAIELAAPRLRSMSVEELSQRLHDRFALLTDGSRAALPRHRTLRSMIDWSYDLLSEAEQAMLRRAAVFSGGWTLSRAEAICSGDGIDATAVLELLTSLVDKSLVLADERDDATRYRMLETVRQYALDRLRASGEQAQWQARHLASFLALAEETKQTRGGAKGRSLLDEVAGEHDNMRAALHYCVAARLGQGLRLAAALNHFWFTRSHHITEGREWYTRLLDAVPKDIAPYDRADVLLCAGRLAGEQSDYDAAEALYRQSVTLFREIKERRREAYALTNLVSVAINRGRYAEAEPLSLECLALARSVGDPRAISANLSHGAVIAWRVRRDRKKAFQALDEALDIARNSGDEPLIVQFLKDKAEIARQEGMLALAEQDLVEALTIAQALGSALHMARVLEGIAELALGKHAPERAARIWGATEHLREEIAIPVQLAERAGYQKAFAAARASVGDDAFDRAWNEGRAMALEDAVKYALSGEDTPHRH